MNTLIAQEGSVTWFDDLKLEDFPTPIPSGVRILARQGQVGLDIQGLAGALPLLDGRTLRILPKIGNANFLRLLFVAEGNQQELTREYEEFVSYSTDDDTTVEQVAARSLLSSIGEIMRRSPKPCRTPKKVFGDFSRGQIIPVETALKLAQRVSSPVVSKTKVRSIDTPENRLLSEAAVRAFSMLDIDDQLTHAKTYHAWLQRFERSRQITSDLEAIERGFARNHYGGPRGYYQKALMLAQVILGSNGLSLSGQNEQVWGDSLLINTADIFEKYLRRVIQFNYEDKGFIVTKGDSNSASLYTNGSFSLEPDIVIQNGNNIALIADAKYKEPTGPDHYQMYVYLRRYSVKSGVLICPNFVSNECKIREFLTPDRLVVRELHVPMNDLDLTETKLASIVQDFSVGY